MAMCDYVGVDPNFGFKVCLITIISGTVFGSEWFRMPAWGADSSQSVPLMERQQVCLRPNWLLLG